MSYKSLLVNRDSIHNFYNKYPFPDFDINKYHSIYDLHDNAKWFYSALNTYIPSNKTIIDLGCGTGQLSCLLAAKDRKVIGIDFSDHSIKKANVLKSKLNISNVSFLQKNIMELDFSKESFDYALCNGVLHHIPEPFSAFKKIVEMTRRGGYVIIGLYNTYGRFCHTWKRFWMQALNKLDIDDEDSMKRLLRKQLGEDEDDMLKIRSWFMDQFCNPYETTHTIGEILLWFRKTDLHYVNSLPPIELFESSPYSGLERCQVNPFLKKNIKPFQVCSLALIIKQLKWVYTLRNAGGYFLLVAQKKEQDSL